MITNLRKIALAAAVAFALCLGSQAAFAATASGDIIGLTDLATMGAVRPNTYTADINGIEEEFTLQIVRLVEDASGAFVPVGFPTSADAEKVTWSHNTPNMENGYIITAKALPLAIGGYYLSVDTYNLVQTLGPDSWRATDADGNYGDFSFVATAYNAQDTGQVSDIQIEFYDDNPTISPDFAAGSFTTVNGNDDYDSALGDVGRSWPTPLDAVAHGTLSTPPVITTYHKVTDTQDLQDIVDLNGNTHAPSPATERGSWLYAVYYPDTVTAGTYNRDPVSEVVGYDDYVLEEGALVIFAIGDYGDWKLYHSYFPDVIYRP
ncbi:MAG: hypothetical protein LBS75_01290 [Synergistaceae bacterium]|jgi:hypothetical protein|nr:hypothetical protein [Synergistaceae bacterium]